MSLDITRSALLDRVPHGFFGRSGGVSRAPVAGLNGGLGSKDDPAAVTANRLLAADALLPGAPLVGVYQVHGVDTVTVTEPWLDSARPRADALVTNQPGLLLAIVTADCAPVLLADREAGVVGAAHAGWRGAVGGITDSVIAAMLALGARTDRIAAAVGPCIARASYEVDQGFYDHFVTDDPANAAFFATGQSERPHFDLEAYVVARLAAAGIGRVDALGLDTCALADRYFSFRRASRGGDPDYGRQLSIIGLSG